MAIPGQTGRWGSCGLCSDPTDKLGICMKRLSAVSTRDRLRWPAESASHSRDRVVRSRGSDWLAHSLEEGSFGPRAILKGARPCRNTVPPESIYLPIKRRRYGLGGG